MDGTLTDGGMFFSEEGEAFKRFSSRDGAGFHILKHYYGIKIAFITSEKGGINKARFQKLNDLGVVDDFADNAFGKGKEYKIMNLCRRYKVLPEEVAYMGDDTNDIEALETVGYKGCPADAHHKIKKIPGIMISKIRGGHGAVRDFIDTLISMDRIDIFPFKE